MKGMSPAYFSPTASLPQDAQASIWAEARAFLRAYHAETNTPNLNARLRDVEAEIAECGSYQLLSAELVHGAKMAWRNSARCVGRLHWPALTVRDLRHLREPAAIFAELRRHLHLAWNGGQLQPLMSVFGPDVQIINDQLIRYAGYANGSGDPQNRALTDFLCAQGWTPPAEPGPYDVLPLAIKASGQVQLYHLVREDVREVSFSHPESPAFAGLNLKWHALPVISDMPLSVGGLQFECAPFSGWYVQTEIAARNLADAERYDQLPAVARALGLDTRRERSLWRDRALLELSVAVLHSFDAAGVRLADHHRVSRQFVRFEARERRAGRAVQGRWSWLISPLSPALTPIWQRHYQEDAALRPAFLKRLPGWEGAKGGPAKCPFHG